jgi:hypothetical protein
VRTLGIGETTLRSDDEHDVATVGDIDPSERLLGGFVQAEDKGGLRGPRIKLRQGVHIVYGGHA